MPLATKVWLRLSLLHWAFITASFSKPLLWERMSAWFATSVANIFGVPLEAYLQHVLAYLHRKQHISLLVFYMYPLLLARPRLIFLESVLGGGPGSRQLEHGLEASTIPSSPNHLPIPVPFSWVPLDPSFPNYSVFTLTPKHIMGPSFTPQYTTTKSQ